MSQSKNAVKSVVIMVVFSLISSLLGFLREALIAAKFGAGIESDAFFIALTATTLLTLMITKTINTTMIPVFSEIEVKEGKSGKIKHVNNFLNVVFIVSIVIILLGWIFAPVIIRLLAFGFQGSQFELAVLLMRIGLPAIFFAGTLGVLRGFLQSELKFIESATTQLPFNLVYIFFLVFLASIFGIKGLMITSVLAVASQILIQIPGVRKTGFKYRAVVDIKDKYFKKIAHLAPPVLLSVAVSDINQIVDKSLASTLVNGSVSALNYADRIKGLIQGIFIMAIATVIFPILSKESNKENYEGFKRIMRYGINIIVLISIPATVGIIVLADPIVSIAFERGAFDSKAKYMTIGALIFYSLGLLGMALRTFLNKVYYSLSDTKTPMINGIIAVFFNIILNFILVRFMAHEGLALATSISATITTGLLFYGLKKKIGYLGVTKYLICAVKSLFASMIMAIVIYLIYYNLETTMVGNSLEHIALFLFSVGAGVFVYVIVIYILKVEELSWLINIIKQKLKKGNSR
ncbi:murein biosynthesis integral membrane protein MurJ [Salinicoccus roseus]|uniref:murein biosynthesis integral membrane protein MurJ n=1 Tax=Salinicoccus roseus TaxID=45670 RepID=UPI00230018E0|nr:murein biosynthesis integral membrane protein MurJ [Salinicoccus roseus]